MTRPAAFQPDRPDDLEESSDLFGHGDYARALATSVLDTGGDFTFGLFGDWGLGKTTVLQALRRELTGNTSCAVVVFDAWRYQDDPFRREFLRDVATQLQEGEALHNWKPEEELGVLDEDVGHARDTGLTLSWPEGVRLLLVLAVLAAVLLVIGGIVFDVADGVVVSLVALMPLVAFALVRLERVVKVRQESVTRKRLEDPDRFAAVFRSLVAHVNREVLVVGIDNLDRLPADEAIEVLATVKTFLEPAAERARTSTVKALLGAKDLPDTKVVFVVAVDDGALRHHLQTRVPDERMSNAEAARYADEYLRKFFNASTTLRPLLTGDLSAYIRKRLVPLFDRLPEPAAPRGVAEGFPRRTDPPLFPDEPHYPSRAEQLDRTVEMATVALRRNPRRVLQSRRTPLPRLTGKPDGGPRR
jgi:hypothetical protein